jgi:uncharacterized membrane protein required for colicin V production
MFFKDLTHMLSFGIPCFFLYSHIKVHVPFLDEKYVYLKIQLICHVALFYYATCQILMDG